MPTSLLPPKLERHRVSWWSELRDVAVGVLLFVVLPVLLIVGFGDDWFSWLP